MLKHLNFPDHAQKIENAVLSVLGSGKVRSGGHVCGERGRETKGCLWEDAGGWSCAEFTSLTGSSASRATWAEVPAPRSIRRP